MLVNTTKFQMGDCEACDKPDGKNCKLRLATGGIWLCSTCYDAEVAANTRAQQHVQQMIQDNRKVETPVVVKQDVFVAFSIPITEKKAAIENDTQIPADKKQQALADVLTSRIKELNAAIFEVDAKALALKEERSTYQANLREVVATLQATEREKYKQYDINYTPAKPTKKTHTTKPVTEPVKFDKVAIYAASKRYGISPSDIQMRLLTKKNKTPETAAAYLCEQVAGKYSIDFEMLHATVIGRKITAEEAAQELKKIL